MKTPWQYYRSIEQKVRPYGQERLENRPVSEDADGLRSETAGRSTDATEAIRSDVAQAKTGVGDRRASKVRRVLYAFGGGVFLFCLWTLASIVLLVHSATPIMDHYVDKLTLLLPAGGMRPVPDLMTDALVAAEDRNFYEHHGVDWEAERWALRKDITSISFSHGGSTITMQAVRYIMLPYSKTPARKIAQIVLALRLERRLSKQQILRLYVDSVSFGLHTAGLQNAAKTYFNKRPEKLTLAQCAFLAGAISHPPKSIKQVTPEFVQARMAPVLAHMEELFGGKYPTGAFEKARRETLHFAWETRVGDIEKERHQ